MIAKSTKRCKPSRSSKLSIAGATSLLALSGLSFVLASGGSVSEAGPAPSGHETVSVAAGSTVETENYKLTMLPIGQYEAGKEGVVEVNIVPKGAFHINQQYPFKIKMADPPPENVTYPRGIMGRADGKFIEKLGTWKVPFVATKSGKAKVAGKVSFSVCSDANCLMDKVDLELTVDAR